MVKPHLNIKCKECREGEDIEEAESYSDYINEYISNMYNHDCVSKHRHLFNHIAIPYGPYPIERDEYMILQIIWQDNIVKMSYLQQHKPSFFTGFTNDIGEKIIIPDKFLSSEYCEQFPTLDSKNLAVLMLVDGYIYDSEINEWISINNSLSDLLVGIPLELKELNKYKLNVGVRECNRRLISLIDFDFIFPNTKKEVLKQASIIPSILTLIEEMEKSLEYHMYGMFDNNNLFNMMLTKLEDKRLLKFISKEFINKYFTKFDYLRL